MTGPMADKVATAALIVWRLGVAILAPYAVYVLFIRAVGSSC